MKENRIRSDKPANYFLPFYNRLKTDQNDIEEIIEINQIEKQPCLVEEVDCQKSLALLGYEEAKENFALGHTENVIYTGDNIITEEAIEEVPNITQEDGAYKDHNTAEEKLLPEERSDTGALYNTLREEKNGSNKINVIEILSRLKGISNRIKQ